jgi:hypothetical protein
VFSILKHLVSENLWNYKCQEEYSLFYLVTQCDHKSCLQPLTWPYKLKIQFILICEYNFITTQLQFFKYILLNVHLREMTILCRLAQLRQISLQYKIRQQNTKKTNPTHSHIIQPSVYTQTNISVLIQHKFDSTCHHCDCAKCPWRQVYLISDHLYICIITERRNSTDLPKGQLNYSMLTLTISM